MTNPRTNSIADASQLCEGQSYTASVTVTSEKLAAFVDLTGDVAPIHTDPGFAAAKGHKACLAHGLLVGSFYSTILGCHLPGPNTVIARIALDMLRPVYVGDVLAYTARVERVSEAVGSVSLALFAVNQSGETVSRGTAVCVFR
jgi:acyl dehydratase